MYYKSKLKFLTKTDDNNILKASKTLQNQYSFLLWFNRRNHSYNVYFLRYEKHMGTTKEINLAWECRNNVKLWLCSGNQLFDVLGTDDDQKRKESKNKKKPYLNK